MMIIRLRSEVGIMAETITAILFPCIGDFVMVLFTSGVLDLLTLDSSNDTSMAYWEETVMFLLLLDKVLLSTVMLLGKFEDRAILAENVCTEVKMLVFMSLDGIGEQGTLAR